MADFRLALDLAAIADLADSPEAEIMMQDVGDQVADRAYTLAPKDTGAGAASIHAEVDRENGAVVGKVGWDDQHNYMQFQETGTEKMAPYPFLRPALDSTHI